MFIDIKSSYDIFKIQQSCTVAANTLKKISKHIEAGISTEELDLICHKYIISNRNSFPAALGYCGFPKSVCISINDVVCHGIPSKETKLKSGDILNIDIAIIKDGYYGDTSKMFYVGKTSISGLNLCKTAKKSLYLAIEIVRPGIRLREIGRTIQKYVESKNYSIVREYCGHGIGKNFHESPQILHYDAYDQEIILKPGMVFTIEPMINAGSRHVYTMPDGWTVKTKDGKLSAQYEHTVLVTQKGSKVMTMSSYENVKNIV
ncbi:MAG: methionine aminopeptidase [Wigglesworthia glossinidia]|nr:methionine aminopeptidase [Wigglesworthia glossinidia]